MAMIKSIRHTGLVVKDLDRALDFWCNLLGFNLEKKQEESGPYIDALLGMQGVQLTTVKLSAPDGNLIEILYFHSQCKNQLLSWKPNTNGFTHIAMTVDDLDAVCLKLKKNGYSIFSEPQFSPDGYAKVIYSTGPEGILLEFVEVLK